MVDLQIAIDVGLEGSRVRHDGHVGLQELVNTLFQGHLPESAAFLDDVGVGDHHLCLELLFHLCWEQLGHVGVDDRKEGRRSHLTVLCREFPDPCKPIAFLDLEHGLICWGGVRIDVTNVPVRVQMSYPWKRIGKMGKIIIRSLRERGLYHFISLLFGGPAPSSAWCWWWSCSWCWCS